MGVGAGEHGNQFWEFMCFRYWYLGAVCSLLNIAKSDFWYNLGAFIPVDHPLVVHSMITLFLYFSNFSL